MKASSVIKFQKEQALDRYMAHTERARQLVNELQLWVEDHGEVAPDDVNWNHVGTMSMVADTLQEMVEGIRSE